MPPRNYFPDSNHPCRESFTCEGKSFKRYRDGTFVDGAVQNSYRNFQLCNQMHRCTFSCYKYCKIGEPLKCRHNYPYDKDGPTKYDAAVIFRNHDRRKRLRVNVYPPRNNANINSTFFDPLLVLAHKGNHDCQYISNPVGAAEYAASYVGKQERADFKMVCNLLFRALDAQRENNSDLHRLKCVGKTILDSTPVGAVEAMYSLLGLPFVLKSRVVENFNALHRSKMTKSLELDTERLESMNLDEEPVKKGIYSNLGKRFAYETLKNNQLAHFGKCSITLYSMLTNYKCSLKDEDIKKDVSYPSPDLIELNDAGSVIKTPLNNRFQVNNIIYCRRKKNAVINLCPYIPFDKTDEQSCYATLLLHVPWPSEGEDALLCDKSSAVSQLNYLLESDNQSIPKYVKPLLERVEKSQKFFIDNNDTNDKTDNASTTDDDHDSDTGTESTTDELHDDNLQFDVDDIHEIAPVNNYSSVIFVLIIYS